MGPEGYDPSATNLRQPDTPVEMKVFQGGGYSEGQIGGGPQESLLPQPETPVAMKVFQGGGYGSVQTGGSAEWMTAFDGGYTFFEKSEYFKSVKLRSLSTQPPKIAAAIYILAKDTGRVMLYKRAQEKTIGGPGGNVDPGEPVWLTALREASEEVGFLPRFNIQDTYWTWFASHILPTGLIDVSQPKGIDPQLIQAASLLNDIKNNLIPIYASNTIVAYLYFIENENEAVKAQVGEVDTSYDWSDFQTVGKDIGTVREGIAYVGFPDILQHIKANYSSLSKSSEPKQLVVLKCLMILHTIREATDESSLSKRLLTIATTQSLSELLQTIPGPQQQPPQAQQSPQTPTIPSDLATKLSGLTFRGVKFTDLAKDPAFASFQPIAIPTPAFKESWLTSPIDVQVDGVKTVVAPLSAGPEDLYLFHPLGGECTPDRLQTAWGDASEPFVVVFGTPLLKPFTSIFFNTGQAASASPVGTPSAPGKTSQQPYVIDNKTPTVTLSNGITVRYMEIGDPLKKDIMDLKFTADEDYLFTKGLKFRKPWILQWIKQPGHSEEFYRFWKVYVNRDGTSELTLATSREKNTISQFLQKLLKEYQKALHTATWDWLKTKYPDSYDNFAEDYDAGFFFTTPKAALATPSKPASRSPPASPSGSPPPASSPQEPSPESSVGTPSPVTPARTIAQDRPRRQAAIERVAQLVKRVREDIGDSIDEEKPEENGSANYDPSENDELPKLTPAERQTKEVTPAEQERVYLSTLVDLVNRVLTKKELDSQDKVNEIISIFVPDDADLKGDVKEFLQNYEPTQTAEPRDARKWQPSKTSYYGADVGSILNDLMSLDPATLLDANKYKEFIDIFAKIHPPSKAAQRAYAKKLAQKQQRNATQPPKGKGKPVQPQAAPAVPVTVAGTAQPQQEPQAAPAVPAAAPGTAQPQQQPQATPAVPAAAPPGNPPAGPVPARKATGRGKRQVSPPPAPTGAAFSPGTAAPDGVKTRAISAQQAPTAAPAAAVEEPLGGKRKRIQGGGGKRSSKGRKTRRKSHKNKSIGSSGSSQGRISRKVRSR